MVVVAFFASTAKVVKRRRDERSLSSIPPGGWRRHRSPFLTASLQIVNKLSSLGNSHFREKLLPRNSRAYPNRPLHRYGNNAIKLSRPKGRQKDAVGLYNAAHSNRSAHSSTVNPLLSSNPPLGRTSVALSESWLGSNHTAPWSRIPPPTSDRPGADETQSPPRHGAAFSCPIITRRARQPVSRGCRPRGLRPASILVAASGLPIDGRWSMSTAMPAAPRE